MDRDLVFIIRQFSKVDTWFYFGPGVLHNDDERLGEFGLAEQSYAAYWGLTDL